MNYMMLLAYDGSRYSGWQVQGNTENTIQGKLEQVLTEITGESVEIAGSGRTDAGVHAKGQVASFKLVRAFACDELKVLLNSRLPKDLAVLSLTEAPERFHARLSAKAKTYVYRISTSPVSNVFEHKYLYNFTRPLNLAAMRQAAALLLGSHDFKSFCGNPRMKKSTVRRLDSIEIIEKENKITHKADELELRFTGDGFLMNIVRILTGTLLQVGTGEIKA